MVALTPYHFAQCRTQGFQPFYEAIAAVGGVLCYDWEDSIQQAADPRAEAALKQVQRERVRQVLQQAYRLGACRLAVRLNPPGSPYYAADLAALRGLPGELHAVFIPKVESPATLGQVLRELPLPVHHVVPVVETRTGFANLAAILAATDERLGLVAFGHCDYNLSCGHFPFFHHDTPTYWTWIAHLNAHLRVAGKGLLNSPVLRLADLPHFAAVLSCLRAFESAAGQITLCLAQSRACAAPTTGRIELTDPAPAFDSAAALRGQFERSRRPGQAFALPASRRLISPHEYAAAGQQLADFC